MRYRAEHGIESEWLFPSHSDPAEQLKVSTLNSWAVRFGKMLGVEFYWHAMRHCFCTGLVRAGLPDSVIQEIIGWSSADMVKVYTDIDPDEQIAMWFKDGEMVAPPKRGLDI